MDKILLISVASLFLVVLMVFSLTTGKRWYAEWAERRRIEKEKLAVIREEKRDKAMKLMEKFNNE